MENGGIINLKYVEGFIRDWKAYKNKRYGEKRIISAYERCKGLYSDMVFCNRLNQDVSEALNCLVLLESEVCRIQGHIVTK